MSQKQSEAVESAVNWSFIHSDEIERITREIIASPAVAEMVTIPTAYLGRREDAVAFAIVNLAKAIVREIHCEDN